MIRGFGCEDIGDNRTLRNFPGDLLKVRKVNGTVEAFPNEFNEG